MFNFKQEYLNRIERTRAIENNPELIGAERALCKTDINYFINRWGMTFDPRREPKHFPFMLYDFQAEILKWITDRFDKKENGLIEKSRDMGVTWLCVAWAVHSWLYREGIVVRFGSRKEDLVDDKSMDSIFGKLRYFIQYLPSFLKPKDWDKEENNRYLKLLHPANKNTIVGESANIGMGRGGRSSICFLDEYAHVPHSDIVWSSISENSDCLIPLSTPSGKGNQFSWLRFETKIPTKSIHWSLHPLKNNEWYEKKKAQMKPWQVAQELDLSYEKSAQGRIYDFDRKYHIANQIIDCDLENGEQFVTWDFGVADPTAIVWGQISSYGEIQFWNCFEMSGWDIDFFIPISLGKRPKEYKLLNLEDQKKVDEVIGKIPIGYNRNTAAHFGDHSGTARSINSIRSCRVALKEAGIKFNSSGKQNFDWRISCLERLLKLRHNTKQNKWYSIIQVSSNCTRLIDCFNNYKWDSDDLNKESIKPLHNEYSHMMSAVEFFAINRFPLRKSTGYREVAIR